MKKSAMVIFMAPMVITNIERTLTRVNLLLHRVVLVSLLLAGVSCSTTVYHEREKLAHRCMSYDVERGLVFLRNKMEAAREGALGGFGAAAAGSCGCQ